MATGKQDAHAVTALLFHRDRVEEVHDWSGPVKRLGRSSILWVDLQRPDEEDVRRLVEALELDELSAQRLARPRGEPFFGDFGSYIHVTANVPSSGDDSYGLERLGCLVSKRWMVTTHEGDVPVIETFRERAGGSGNTGRLEGLEFLGDLLDWVLEEYLDAFEEIEVELEKFDSRAMEGRLDDPEAALRGLVELRKQTGWLRRALVSHRRMFLSLMQPELADMSSSVTAERFSALRARLEDAVQAARDSRESVVGSFDVLIARTGYRTNEIMKVLTLASVLLLPGALLAGILGMNFKVGLFEHAMLFWVAIGVILAIAATTIAVARRRRWI